MEFKSPLSQRIIVSLVLLTSIVSGLFGLGIILSIHYVEEILVTEEMERDIAHAIGEYRSDRPLRLGYATALHVAGPNLPEYLRPLPPGFTELVLNERAYYVYSARDNDQVYYLVRDQTSFEKREKLLNMVVLGGFVLSILVSLVLGRLLVKKVIAPIQRLTHQVRDREKLLVGTPPLASDYADDEVGALARTFDTTIGKLQQALQRESLFTGDISHELRTPLMIIRSSSDLLAEKGHLDDFSRQRLGMIRKAADEIQKLVEAFLALARGRETSLEKTSLAAVAQAGRQEWEQLAASKGLSFEIQGETGETARSSPLYPEVLLRTVISNLVRNAAHHTVEGKVTLHLRPGGFTLCDTGSGIAPEEKNQIFRLYYRGAAAGSNGMGLGLSLVQRICEREQWAIRLEDNQPNGCCFTVTLH